MRRRERRFRNARIAIRASPGGASARCASRGVVSGRGAHRPEEQLDPGVGANRQPQLIVQLTPYLIGWRGYFGFCQTPRVLTNLEAWIRRRLRAYLWPDSGRTGTIVSTNCGAEACRSSTQRLPPVRRQDSGACQYTRRSNRPCATTTSTRSVSLDFMFLTKLNLVEPPGT